MVHQFVLQAVAQLLVHASMPAQDESMHFSDRHLHLSTANTAYVAKGALEFGYALYEYRRHNLMLQKTGRRSVPEQWCAHN